MLCAYSGVTRPDATSHAAWSCCGPRDFTPNDQRATVVWSPAEEQHSAYHEALQRTQLTP